MFQQCFHYMGQLNKTAALLIMKYGVKSSTDITRYGILGHAQNLAEFKIEPVDNIVERLPCYPVLHTLDKIVRNFKFKEGYAAETSGWLLISMPADNADTFIWAMKQSGCSAWNMAQVEKVDRKAKLVENIQALEI